MENVLKYKDFTGSVQFNTEDRIFHGRIQFITDLVTFEGSSVSELENAFKEAVEDYIELCSSINKTPNKSFSGTFNVRLNPDLHRKAALTSLEKGISLNQLVAEAVNEYIHQR